MTRDDYERIQQMIDASIETEQLDELATHADIEDAKSELGGDIDNLQSQIDSLED